MPFQTAPIPLGDPVVGPNRRMTQPWIDWFGPVLQDLDNAPARVMSVALEDQEASIAAQPMGAGLSSGLYRVSWYARITRAGTVSSGLTVTIGFEESSVVLSTAGALINGNTTATIQSGSVLLRCDGGSLTYATTYASAGATTMQYRLDLIVEQVRA